MRLIVPCPKILWGLLGTLCILFVSSNPSAVAIEKLLVLASTTSADNSGLYKFLFPHFLEDSGIRVHVVAVGSGRALELGKRGDANVLIVHDEERELAFMRNGYGALRKTFMYNQYYVVGPVAIDSDKHTTVEQAFSYIARSPLPFISRGDDSGTHIEEKELWESLGIHPESPWYIQAGGSMGKILNMANELRAYTLTDSSTWASFHNKKNLRLVASNIPPMRNSYSVIVCSSVLVSPTDHRMAMQLYDWILSKRGKSLITQFRINGEQLFFLP